MQPAEPCSDGLYTVEEYLRLEAASAIKHEFRDGRILAMAGGSFDHNLTAGNLIREIGNRKAADGCLAVGSDTRVRVPRNRHYNYPDVSVVCGGPVFDPPDRRVTLLNPRLIIEVLSPSTEAVDRGEKFRDYIGIESLQEYALVGYARPLVETMFRQPEGIWGFGPWAEGMEASIRLRSLEIDVPLSAIYAGVVFPPTRRVDDDRDEAV